MKEIRVVVVCDEGYVAETLRDIAALYENDLGESDFYSAEHGSGFWEEVKSK